MKRKHELLLWAAVLLTVALFLAPLLGFGAFWPTDSYEMGHFAPPPLIGEAGYQTADILLDWLLDEESKSAATRSALEGLKILTGIIANSIAWPYLQSHYQTAEEIGWGKRGAYCWLGFRLPLGLIRGYVWQYRDTRKAYAETVLRAEIFSEDMVMDFMPDGRPFWRSADLIEIKETK